MDYTNGKISKADFIYVLELIENYVFRRSICGIPNEFIKQNICEHYIKKINIEKYKRISWSNFTYKSQVINAFPRDFRVR